MVSTQCRLVNSYRRFGGQCFLHIQGLIAQEVFFPFLDL